MVVMLENEVEIVLARQVEDWGDVCVIYPTADVHDGLGVFSLQKYTVSLLSVLSDSYSFAIFAILCDNMWVG